MELDYIKCGDNVSLIRDLPDRCIDLTITSPPYDGLRKYNGFSFDFENLAKELYRVTKDGGVVVWVVGDETVNGSETLTSFKQAMYFKEVGFNVLDTMIYEKTGTGACGSNYCYIQNFEYMFVLTKGLPKTHNLLYDRENLSYTGKIKKATTKRTSRNDDGSNLMYREYIEHQFGRRFNIWQYPPGNGMDEFQKRHPASFPESLVLDHLLSWSNEGDVVLDPFSGSGTTAKVSMMNNRHYIGFELSDKYTELSNERLRFYSEQLNYKKASLIE